jgi:hypothetical protein
MALSVSHISIIIEIGEYTINLTLQALGATNNNLKSVWKINMLD